MLFNSVFFIAIFLPISLFVYFYFAKISARYAIYSLIALSLIFYGWHTPVNLLLIGFSLGVNYLLLSIIVRQQKKSGLVFGVLFNLLVLSYFKYANFFIDTTNHLLQLNFKFMEVVLPLAISFFTFQMIAFLVDVYRKQVSLPAFPDYCAFILFFPQLIAGPILRHSDFLPQFANPSIYRPNSANLAIGSTIFIIGLFKKTILADSFAPISDMIFKFSQEGNIPSLPEAWLGIMAFSLQIYFDFSGYSDMAIGLARMFNFKFPINFNSPYKATSIIDFWRRWHISLSFLLRDYLYFPLGGNRKGPFRRHLNLLITMLIGGLWHGASWTFVVWGGLHGLYLTINHLARSVFIQSTTPLLLKRMATFLIVSLTWVFFRAESFRSAALFFAGLTGKGGTHLRIHQCTIETKLYFSEVALGLMVCFFLPTIYEWMIRYQPALNNGSLWKDPPSYVRRKGFLWRPTWIYLAITLIILFIAFGNIEHAQEFLYFQF